MLTIVFYAVNGAAAKARAKGIAASKPNTARVYDAMAWDGSADACDAVELLPCVPWWKRDAIEAAYAGKVSEGAPVVAAEVVMPLNRTSLGDLPKRRGRPPKVRDDAS